MITDKDLETIRRRLSKSAGVATTALTWEMVMSRATERGCQNCGQLFTLREPHHRLCHDCWMRRYHDWERRKFGRVLAVKGARGEDRED